MEIRLIIWKYESRILLYVSDFIVFGEDYFVEWVTTLTRKGNKYGKSELKNHKRMFISFKMYDKLLSI